MFEHKIDINFLIGHDANGKYDVFDMDRHKLGGPFDSMEIANEFVKQMVEKKVDALRKKGLHIEVGETEDTTIYSDHDNPISVTEAVALVKEKTTIVH